MQHKMTHEQLFGLLGAKTSKKKDKELRTPRQIAELHVYKDNDGCCVIPTNYIIGAFKDVSSDYRQSSSSKKSIRSIAGGVFRPETEFARLINNKGKNIKDFEVDVRKGTNHLKGAVAICRPRFDDWKTNFVICIDDDLINPDVALQILNDAGKRSGIGSFRVSRGGYFGQFVVTCFKEITS